jgi:outer membrane protein TolC
MRKVSRHNIIVMVLAVFLLCSGQASFAQNPSAERVALGREDLKFEMKPVLQRDNNISGDRQELKLLPKTVLSREVPDIGPTKKIFTTEVGLVDLSIKKPEISAGRFNLNDCIKIAIKNHIPLQVAEKSVTLAKWRLWENRRNMLPTATMVYEEYNGAVYGRKYIGRKEYVEGQQPVFHGGELYYTMKQSETNLEVVKSDYNRIKNDLVLQVKKAYYSLERAGENIKIQKALALEAARILDMINRQYEANITPKIEFLNVCSQASQVKYQLTSAEGDLSMAGLILKQAMNVDSGDAIEIEPSAEFKKAEVDFEKLQHVALLNRPEMKINSLLIDYYAYGKKIAVAKGWIKIDLVGQWGLSKEEYTSKDAGDSSDTKLEQQYYAGVKASMPIWGSTTEYQWTREQWTPSVSAYQGTEARTNSVKIRLLDKLDYYSDKKVAEIEFDKQRQELTKIKQDIAMEVKEGCFNYAKAMIQLDTATNKVKYQEGDLEVVKLKRSMEEAQDSNVIESMIKLAQEKFGYLQALSDCRIALAGLNKAVGIEDYFDNEHKVSESVVRKPSAKDKKAPSFWLRGWKKVPPKTKSQK